jgi:glycosyltransferase domain-containing protein
MYSVVIPTKTRHLTLARQLSYISNFNLKDVKEIIILDSSTKNFLQSEQFKEIEINQIQNKIRYLQFEENTIYAKKLLSGSKIISTNSCLLISDDDFVNFDVVKLLKKKLETDENLVFVTGDQYLININDSKLIPIDFYKLYSEASNNMLKESYERINFYLNRKSILSYYGIFKTECFKKTWQQVSNLSDDFLLQEALFNIMLLHHGKSYRLPLFYSARQPNLNIDYEKHFNLIKNSFAENRIQKYFERLKFINRYNKIKKDDFINFFTIKKSYQKKKNFLHRLFFSNIVYKISKLILFNIINYKYLHVIKKIKYYFLNFDTYKEIKDSRTY